MAEERPPQAGPLLANESRARAGWWPDGPTAQVWEAAPARVPQGRAPHGFQRAGALDFRAGGGGGGSQRCRGLSAAAAERAAHPERPLTSARPRTCPWAAHTGAPGRKGIRPPFSRAPPGSARARSPTARPREAPAPPAATDGPRPGRAAGSRSQRRGCHAAAAPPALCLPLSPKVRRANYCKLKLIKLLFPFPSPRERWRDPAPAGGLTPSGHPVGRSQGPGEGEAPSRSVAGKVRRGCYRSQSCWGPLSKPELFRF